MRWFKHLTATWQDEKIAELIEEFGLEGYGFYWRILEIIAGNMDEKCQTFASFSPKVWGKFCGISAKKFQKLAESMAKLRLFFVKVSEKNSKTIITIDCPNLLKYKDEWTKRKSRKSRVTPEKLQSDSCYRTDTESDTESQSETKSQSQYTRNILEKIKNKPVVDDLLKMNKEQLNKLYCEYNGADPDPIVILILYIAGSRKYLHTDPPWDVLERLMFNTPYSVVWVRDAIIEMGNRIKRGGLVKNFNYGTILKIIKGWENQGLSEVESPLEHFEKIQSDVNREQDRKRGNERGREENVVKCFDYYPIS